MGSKAEMPRVDERCEKCRFWHPDQPAVYGECRRHAPVIPADPYAVRAWPGVKPNDWCGEWQGEELANGLQLSLHAPPLQNPPRCVPMGDLPILQQGTVMLELSMRTINLIERSGVALIGHLVACSAGELMHINGFGPASLADVRNKLAARGLYLRGEGPPDAPTVS